MGFHKRGSIVDWYRTICLPERESRDGVSFSEAYQKVNIKNEYVSEGPVSRRQLRNVGQRANLVSPVYHSCTIAV